MTSIDKHQKNGNEDFETVRMKRVALYIACGTLSLYIGHLVGNDILQESYEQDLSDLRSLVQILYSIYSANAPKTRIKLSY